jgi:stage V sporulation protein G
MSSLEITDVRVRLYNKSDDKLKAFATITLNGCFVVSDLKVIQGNKGLFVAMPSRKRKDGKFRDVAHPLNSDTRQMIEERILSLYESERQNPSQPPGVGGDDYEHLGDDLLQEDLRRTGE